VYSKICNRKDNDQYKQDPGKFLYEICIEVCRMAYEKKSRDNVSIIIITFDHKSNAPKKTEEIERDSSEISLNSDSFVDTDVSGDYSENL
jgi:hypothetical protein